MPHATPRRCLPLYFTGVPGWIVETLRAAGLPVEEMNALRWRSELADANGGLNLLVLFDSRAPSSRQNAEVFRRHGCETLDAGGLLHSRRQSTTAGQSSGKFPSRGHRFLERAKQSIESAGFLWARIADFPYPFQSALIDGRDDSAAGSRTMPARLLVTPSNAASSCTTSAGRDTVSADVDDLFSQYVAGAAMHVPSTLPPLVTSILESALSSGRFPLLWRTTWREYIQWRRARDDFRYEVFETNRRYEIRYGELPLRFRPALELWRGGHFAVVPLCRSRQMIDPSQMVYRTAGARHPAGIVLSDDGLDRQRPSVPSTACAG